MRWLDSIIEPMDMSLSKLRQLEMDREACHAGLYYTKIIFLNSRRVSMEIKPVNPKRNKP